MAQAGDLSIPDRTMAALSRPQLFSEKRICSKGGAAGSF
jgi:hypothetical protein